MWTPTPERVAGANITAFMGWLRETRGLEFTNYPDLWQWSVTETDAFWQAIWDYSDVIAVEQPTAVLGQRDMPGAEWFPGARLNYAENVMRLEAPGEVALYYHSETVPVTPMYWDEFGPAVRTLATQLRALGVKPGDQGRLDAAEHPPGRHRHARDHVDRGDLDERVPRLRLAGRARPLPAAAAHGADLHRRLHLQRQGLRPLRRAQADHRRPHVP